MTLSLRLRRGWYRALGVGPAVLLMAIVPQFFYIDHWSEFLTTAFSGQMVVETEANHAAHAAHCHLSPGTCADAPLPASVQVIPTVIDVVHPELPAVALESDASRLREFVTTVLTEPPRS